MLFAIIHLSYKCDSLLITKSDYLVNRNDPACIKLTYQLIKDAYESEFKSGKNNAN